MLSVLLFLSTAYADSSFGITPWNGASFLVTQGGESISGDGAVQFGACNGGRAEAHVALPTHIFDGGTDASLGTYSGHLGVQWFAGRSAAAYAMANHGQVPETCKNAKVNDGKGAGKKVRDVTTADAVAPEGEYDSDLSAAFATGVTTAGAGPEKAAADGYLPEELWLFRFDTDMQWKRTSGFASAGAATPTIGNSGTADVSLGLGFQTRTAGKFSLDLHGTAVQGESVDDAASLVRGETVFAGAAPITGDVNANLAWEFLFSGKKVEVLGGEDGAAQIYPFVHVEGSLGKIVDDASGVVSPDHAAWSASISTGGKSLGKGGGLGLGLSATGTFDGAPVQLTPLFMLTGTIGGTGDSKGQAAAAAAAAAPPAVAPTEK